MKLPDARVGLAIDEIFVRNGVPEDTYVEPEQAAEIKNWLTKGLRTLVLEGPTQIGKTTVVTKLLSESEPAANGGREPLKLTKLDAYSAADVSKLLAITTKPMLEEHLLIENAHHLSDATLQEIVHFIRRIDPDSPKAAKVAILGISNVRSRIRKSHSDFVGRFEPVGMSRQPPAKVRELVTKGASAANLVFDHSEEIVKAARGSFRLAQELCYQCAVVAGVDSVIGDEACKVATPPDDTRVRDAVRCALDDAFKDQVDRFIEADQEQRAPARALRCSGCCRLHPMVVSS